MDSVLCRICSDDFKHGILVFSDEGRRLYLQAKIRKYLYITVSMDDNLPKIICTTCCRKLESIHKFATMAVKNQDKFNKLMTDTNKHPTLEPKKIENKGLLHTYLTKGIVKESSEDTEEMEVRVDPMLFLQYNSDQSDDDDENMTEEDEEEEANPNNTNTTFENGKVLECTICKKHFTSELCLQNHIWYHVPKTKRIVLNNQNNFCVEVEEENERNTEDEDETVINNNNDDDGDGNRFGCPICGKIISTKGNLKVHLETHRPKGKYGCDICGRIFKTQSNLYRHKDYHTGIQFTCTVCGRVYPTNSTLRAHSITHSNLRPHKCPLCDKTFKRNQDLKFHINQHTGARPYQCPYCPKAFASSGNCFSHRKRMHPAEVERDRERAAKIMR